MPFLPRMRWPVRHSSSGREGCEASSLCVKACPGHAISLVSADERHGPRSAALTQADGRSDVAHTFRDCGLGTYRRLIAAGDNVAGLSGNERVAHGFCHYSQSIHNPGILGANRQESGRMKGAGISADRITNPALTVIAVSVCGWWVRTGGLAPLRRPDFPMYMPLAAVAARHGIRIYRSGVTINDGRT